MFLIFINFAVEKHLHLLTFFNMAKRVFMIAPFEAMTGNLSGDQDLQYAENNNPAYEAPNGTQYARNYRTRYVGARRGRDGLVYFQVKQTTATVLTPTTRRTMAILGVTAAIRSAMQTSGVLNNFKIYFDQLKQAGTLPEGQDTFNKWFSANIKSMLVYKRAEWRFTLPGVGIVSIHNPYDLASGEALNIKLSVWVKFANMFAFTGTQGGGVFYTIDGTAMFAPYDEGGTLPTFNTISKTNPHMTTLYAPMVVSGQYITWNGQSVYTSAGVELESDSVVVANEKYTTADPNV